MNQDKTLTAEQWMEMYHGNLQDPEAVASFHRMSQEEMSKVPDLIRTDFLRSITSYFIDGTPYSYLPVAAGDPVPLNVGWLDAHHEFRKTKHPDDLSNKLAWLCVNAESQATRGIHICELCPRMNDGYYRLQIPKREDFLLGNAEIRISSAKAIYAAPNLILHYVADHYYSPPDDFIEAVLALPDSNSILEWQLVRGARW